MNDIDPQSGQATGETNEKTLVLQIGSKYIQYGYALDPSSKRVVNAVATKKTIAHLPFQNKNIQVKKDLDIDLDQNKRAKVDVQGDMETTSRRSLRNRDDKTENNALDFTSDTEDDQPTQEDSITTDGGSDAFLLDDQYEKARRKTEKMLKDFVYKPPLGRKAHPTIHDSIKLNVKQVPIITSFTTDFETEWIDTNLSHYISDDVWKVSNLEEAYIVRSPIKYGSLNFDDYNNGTQDSDLRDDLTRMLSFIFTDKLKLESAEQYNDIRVLMIIPTLYLSQEIRSSELEMYSDIILNDYNFKSIGFIQDSVCASFGSGYTTACIIDFGATKTAITCIEDGVVLPYSCNTLLFGGDDLNKFAEYLYRIIKIPYSELNMVGFGYDYELIESLKLRTCSLAFDTLAPNHFSFKVKRHKCDTREFKFYTYKENFSIPALYMVTSPKPARRLVDKQALLTSDNAADGISPSPQCYKCQWKGCSHMYEDIYKLWNHLISGHVDKGDKEVVCGWADCARGGKIFTTRASFHVHLKVHVGYDHQGIPNGANGISLSAATIAPENFLVQAYENSKIITEKTATYSVQAAIIQSIRSIESDDLQKKIARTIILAGGSFGFNYFAQTLQQELDSYRLKKQLPMDVEFIVANHTMKDVDPKILSWKGAAIAARLETSTDFFISKLEFNTLRGSIIADKCPFITL